MINLTPEFISSLSKTALRRAARAMVELAAHRGEAVQVGTTETITVYAKTPMAIERACERGALALGHLLTDATGVTSRTVHIGGLKNYANFKYSVIGLRRDTPTEATLSFPVPLFEVEPPLPRRKGVRIEEVYYQLLEVA